MAMDRTPAIDRLITVVQTVAARLGQRLGRKEMSEEDMAPITQVLGGSDMGMLCGPPPPRNGQAPEFGHNSTPSCLNLLTYLPSVFGIVCPHTPFVFTSADDKATYKSAVNLPHLSNYPCSGCF